MTVDVESDARLAHTLYLNYMRERSAPFMREFEQDARWWRQLSRLVASSGLEMGTFMEAQFDSLEDVRGLSPRVLSQKENFASTKKRYYRKVPKTTKNAYEDSFTILRNQLMVYELQMIPECYGSLNELLRDFNMPLPAWFRILLADSDQAGYAEVLKCYEELAKEEFETDFGLRLFLESLEGGYDAARFRQFIR